MSETAVSRAREKAQARGVSADFHAGDILTMQLPSAGFDVVIDSGLFHSFSDEDRARYVETIARVLRPGGAYYLMCFSDRNPAIGAHAG